MNILLSIDTVDTVQLRILQTIINHEGHEDHEGSIYVLNFIMLFFVPFVFFVVISKFMRRLFTLGALKSAKPECLMSRADPKFCRLFAGRSARPLQDGDWGLPLALLGLR